MFGSVLDPEQAFGTMGHVTRTRVRRRRAIAVAAVAVLGGMWAGPMARASGDAARPPAAHRYVVRAGDTAWSISERFSGSADPRPLMDAIVRANDLDPARLTPGRALLIPSV
jgi:nucleoid-associated protein YgaU